MNEKKSLLKIALAEIINGYTPAYSEKFGWFFIKHFSILDSSDIEQEYERVYNLAQSSGLPTIEQREVEILKDKIWDSDKDTKLRELEKFVPNLRITKSKLFRDTDLNSVQKQIDDAESEIKNLKILKEALIGVTCESFASKKTNEYFIYRALFDDNLLQKRKFSQRDYDELEENDIYELVKIYNEALSKFSPQTIKRISVSPQFSNSFALAANNPYTYYGKPIVQLTFYQINLFNDAVYFKSIIERSNGSVPQEVINDPDKLVEWFNATQTADKLIDEAEKNLAKNGKESLGGGISIVGASASDMKKIGMENKGGNNLMKLAAEKGGSLSFEDIIRANGV